MTRSTPMARKEGGREAHVQERTLCVLTVGRQAITGLIANEKAIELYSKFGQRPAEGRRKEREPTRARRRWCGRRKGQGGRGRHIVRNGGIRKRAGRFLKNGRGVG